VPSTPSLPIFRALILITPRRPLFATFDRQPNEPSALDAPPEPCLRNTSTNLLVHDAANSSQVSVQLRGARRRETVAAKHVFPKRSGDGTQHGSSNAPQWRGRKSARQEAQRGAQVREKRVDFRSGREGGGRGCRRAAERRPGVSARKK